MSDLLKVLQNTFGYSEFRPLQQEIIQATSTGAMSSRSCPPGAESPSAFQLPALLRKGLTVVVSPLIALMKDQVDQLQAAGVAATFLNSTLARSRRETAFAACTTASFACSTLRPSG